MFKNYKQNTYNRKRTTFFRPTNNTQCIICEPRIKIVFLTVKLERSKKKTITFVYSVFVPSPVALLDPLHCYVRDS